MGEKFSKQTADNNTTNHPNDAEAKVNTNNVEEEEEEENKDDIPNGPNTINQHDENPEDDDMFDDDFDIEDIRNGLNISNGFNDYDEKTKEGELLLCHLNIDTSKIEKLLDLVNSNENGTQLLSFIIDAYHLEQYNKKINDESYTPQTMMEFINKYSIDEHANFNTTTNDINQLYNDFCSFGGTVALTAESMISPSYKIKDNMSAFMSYTFGINYAIKQYIKPEPPISPFIIDFWIIPNRTINTKDDDKKEVDNNIGNISIRLRQNKSVFITTKCKPDDIKKFAKMILNNLSHKKIKNVMKEKQLKRVIFIVDRRYNKPFDRLYCILPPSEYGKVVKKSSFDILNISHWYCSSNYLLPNTDYYMNEENDDEHIGFGASKDLNGYMFNLSYLIFPNPFDENEENKENENKQEAQEEEEKKYDKKEQVQVGMNKIEKSKDNQSNKDQSYSIQQKQQKRAQQSPQQQQQQQQQPEQQQKQVVINSINSSTQKVVRFNVEEKTEITKGTKTMEEKKYDGIDDDVDDNDDNLNNNDDIQWSTSNVKVLFSTQQMMIRFTPDQMIKIWKNYFVEAGQELISAKNVKLKDIVSNLFELNLYDPYFVDTKNEIQQINKDNDGIDINQDLKFKYCMQPNTKINAADILTKYSKKWEKVSCQTAIDRVQNKGNLQLRLLDGVIPTENVEYKSQFIQPPAQETPILVESDGHSRPKINIRRQDNRRGIYDCICWENQGVLQKPINEYIKHDLKWSDIIKEEKNEEKEIEIIADQMRKLDVIYKGSKFLENNESLLINDGIVPYAYYLCIVSHIIQHLLKPNNCPFQFGVTFICKSVISTQGDKVRKLRLDEKHVINRWDPVRLDGKHSLRQHIVTMAKYMTTFYDGNPKDQRINLIIDRRESKTNSIDCKYHIHFTDFNRSASKMNKEIPGFTKEEISNPHLFHINFYNFDHDKIKAYFIRNESVIRFFPELMMNLWPKIFSGDPTFLQDIVYKHKFRHSFAVKLEDKEFTKHYYAIFNRKFISINYYRERRQEIINDNDNNNDNDSDNGLDLDGPPMMIRAHTVEFKGLLDAKKCDINNDDIESSKCPVIRKITFLLQKQHEADTQGADQVIKIFNQSGYTVTNLMDDVYHLYEEHKFISNKTAHKDIKEYIVKTAHIEECGDDDCQSMRRHCRKSLSVIHSNAASPADKRYSNRNEITKTWITQFDKIHCSLFHQNAKTFRFRYGRMKSTRNKLIMPDSVSYDKFSMLRFGVSVDEWLKHGEDEPDFKDMEEEVLRNRYEPVDVATLKQIKCEVQSRYLSLHSNKQHLNIEEILSLKLFTDLDNLQKEFSKAFWDDETEDIINRRKQFYHWANVLRRAFKYGNIPIRQELYRGYDKVLQLPSFNPFCGQPTSTTTDLRVAYQFAEDKGIVITSNKSEIVYGMDVSWFSRFQNEREVWIYDVVFPIQKAMVMLDDDPVRTKYIQTHLTEIDHQLTGDIKQFLPVNDPNANNVEEEIKNNEKLMEIPTNYRGLNVFERLFFEWNRYSFKAEGLDTFEKLMGDSYLTVENGYFYIVGIRDIVIDTFNPTTFRIEYNDNDTNWKKYYVDCSRLDKDSKNLIQIKTQQMKYRFVAEYILATHDIKRTLKSVIKGIEFTVQEFNQIDNILSRSKREIKMEDDETSDSESDDTPYSLIGQIDAGMSRYYKRHNRLDYYDENGEGLFTLYCEDNGFDDDVVEAEMDAEPDECMLVDMDETFPFKKPPRDRDKAIFDVILRCYDDPDAYQYELKYEVFDVTPNDFDIRNDSQETRIITEQHKRQCINIFRKGFQEDRVMVKLLAVGARINQPYLILLADMYARDRLTSRILKMDTWAATNRHVLKLKRVHNAYQEVQSALKSWYHIVCPILMLGAQTKIQDSLEKACEYITHAVDFVYNFTKKNDDLCPFQYDYMMVFPDVTMDSDTYTPIYDDDDDDDDDDEDDDDDDYHRGDEYAFIDCVGDIKAKLKRNNCLYDASVIELKTDQSQYTMNQTKLTSNVQLNKRFEIFKQKKMSTKLHGHDLMDYPLRKRVCTLIDRRNKDKSGNDKCVFFEPPKDCNTFPRGSNYSQLWYFNSSLTCLIPHMYYNEDLESPFHAMTRRQANQTTKEKLLSQCIGANSHCKGALMTLSFHVESLKETRCYFFLNGQMSRFMPEDLMNILPAFFKQDTINKEFAKSKEIEQMVKFMKTKLRDHRFESFYKQNSTAK